MCLSDNPDVDRSTKPICLYVNSKVMILYNLEEKKVRYAP